MTPAITTRTLIIALAVATLGMTLVAAGLWVTQPADLSSQVALLEARVREDEALIARLKQQHASVSLSHVNAASAGASPVIGAAAPEGAASTNSQRTTPGAAAPGVAQPSLTLAATTADTAPAIKSNKRLAEAEAHYAGLINQLGLQPDEKEAFKDLAAQRDDIRKDTFSKLSDPSLTPAQRQAILTDAKAQIGQVDDSVRQFLNNDGDYSTFEKWEAQNIERGQMDDARAVFANNGVPLSPEQESTLMDQSWALRTTDRGLGDPYSADTLAGRRIDQTYINSTLAQNDADTAMLLQQARSYMTPQQIQSLQAARYQQRVQLESRLWGMARTTVR